MRRSLCLLFTALLAIPAASDAARLFHSSGLIVGTPAIPANVKLSDLNHDGVDDLLVGMDFPPGLGVALATGGGSFGPFQIAFTTHGWLFVDSADFDGDGWLDIAGSAHRPDSSQVCALYGNGTGAIVDSFLVRTPALCLRVFPADLDGDGRSDLVAALTDSSVAVYRGNADRTLTFLGRHPTPGSAAGIGFGNVTGSPSLDVIVSSSDYAGVSIFPGNGDGTLGARLDVALGGSGQNVALGILDGQPGLDLVLTNPNVSWATGQAGGFSAPTLLPSGTGITATGLVVSDFDLDGDLDVASPSGNGNLRGIMTWLNDGAGNFGPRVRTGRSVLFPGSLEAGDVEGDGKLDLAFTTALIPSIVVSSGNGDGTFGAPPIAADVPGNIVGLAVGDFNGDGKLDGVGSNTSSHTLHFAAGHGNGAFDPYVSSSTSGLFYTRLAAGLFDDDATLDLVGVIGSASALSFLRGRGDGTFDPPVDYTLPSPGNGITVEDINLDGRMDVAVPCPSANAVAVLIHGAGGLNAAISSATPAGPTAVRFAHMDGDGRLDRVLACANQMVVQLGDGSGGWTTVHEHPLSPTPFELALGDFDEDGFPDAALTQGPTSPFPPANIHVLRGNPGGTFDQDAIADLDWYSVTGSGITSAHLLFARDFDDDGHLDLLAKDGGNRSFAIVARGLGDGTFGPPEAYTSPYSSQGMAIGDFDADGFDDVLGSGQSGSPPNFLGGMILLRNRTAGVVAVAPRSPAPGHVALAITRVAPHPARGAVALGIESTSAGHVRLVLHAAGGRVVRSLPPVALVPGSNRVALDTAGLAPGVYWVRATSETASAVRKVVVID